MQKHLLLISRVEMLQSVVKYHINVGCKSNVMNILGQNGLRCWTRQRSRGERCGAEWQNYSKTNGGGIKEPQQPHLKGVGIRNVGANA